MAAIHGALSAREAPRADFTDQVMAGITEADARRNAVGRLISTSLTPILASATAFFAVALAAHGSAPIGVGPVAIGAAVGVGVVAALWDARSVKRTRTATG